MQVFSEAGVIIFQITFNKACPLHQVLLEWQHNDEVIMREFLFASYNISSVTNTDNMLGYKDSPYKE
jgi:hypothetical protein